MIKFEPEEDLRSSQGWRNMDFMTAGALTVLSFVVYLCTMSRSIPYIDGGELTTVLWTLGIAHPTGYPLFTLLGYAFVHIPFFPEVALRANLFAVVCASISGGIFYFVFLHAQVVLASDEKNPITKKNKQKATKQIVARNNNGGDFALRLVSAAAALSLIFARTFWTQSTVVESYPLQLLLFAVILLTWLRFYSTPTKLRAFFSGLALGLGFVNHMTTVLTVPALIFLLVSAYRQKKFDPRLLYFVIFGGALAGLLYIYLPIRASQHPLMDWGNPDNMQRFIRHVTAKQFRTWMFSSLDVFEHQLGIFCSGLYSEFRITLLIIVLGVITALILHRRYFWWTTTLLASDLLYAANYNIHNIESYFLLAYISLSLFAAIGFRFLVQRFFSKGVIQTNLTQSTIAVVGLTLLFPAVSGFSNFSNVDASKDHSVEMYTRDILTSLPKNSLVLSYQWDTFVAASLYYRNVDNLRSDIIVIDKELLRRSWYAAQIHERFPSLFSSNDLIYDSYQANLRLFENDLAYDPRGIEMSYSNFIREIITGAMRNGRDVFVGPEIEDQYLTGFSKVPFGLDFKLRTDTDYVYCNVADLNGFRAAEIVDNDYSHQIINFYKRMFLARAGYEYAHKRLDLTVSCLDKSLEVDSTSQTIQTAKLKIVQELGRK